MEIAYPELFPTEQRVRVDSFFVGSRTVHEWGTVVSLDGSQLTVQVDFAESGDATFSSANRHISVRTGLKNQAYLCRAEVLAFSEELLILNLTGEIVADELREYFRLDTSLPLSFADAEGKPGIGASEVLNISGGGCKVRVKQPLLAGEQIHVAMTLNTPQPQTISLVARVIYCSPELRSCDYTAGLSYAEINERHRDAIIGYINREQMRSKQATFRPPLFQSSAA